MSDQLRSGIVVAAPEPRLIGEVECDEVYVVAGHTTIQSGAQVYTDEYDIYARLPAWRYSHLTVCHSQGEYARDDDGDGFHEVHVNRIEGFLSLLCLWRRSHRGISQEKLALYLGFFQFVHNARQGGKGLLKSLLSALLA